MDSAVPPFWTSYGQLIGCVVDAHARACPPVPCRYIRVTAFLSRHGRVVSVSYDTGGHNFGVLSQGNRPGIHQFQSAKLAFNVWIADHTLSD
jgi:hypothetical protein